MRGMSRPPEASTMPLVHREIAGNRQVIMVVKALGV